MVTTEKINNVIASLAEMSAFTSNIYSDDKGESLRRELLRRAIAYWRDLDTDELFIEGIEYAKICSELRWPNFQDGGIFEQAIKAAKKIVQEQERYIYHW